MALYLSAAGCPDTSCRRNCILSLSLLILLPRNTEGAAPAPVTPGVMATGRNFSLVLRLLVFLSCIKTTQRDQDDNGRFQGQGSHNHTDTHSLSCNITVKVHTTPQHPQCEVQCSLDEVPFLWYDNDNKATHLGDLGKAVHATQVWTDFIQRLESLGQELRKMLADTKQETTETSGHRTLQATMLSKYEQGQIVDASWRFNISGKNSFILNTMNMNWTPIRKS